MLSSWLALVFQNNKLKINIEIRKFDGMHTWLKSFVTMLYTFLHFFGMKLKEHGSSHLCSFVLELRLLCSRIQTDTITAHSLNNTLQPSSSRPAITQWTPLEHKLNQRVRRGGELQESVRHTTLKKKGVAGSKHLLNKKQDIQFYLLVYNNFTIIAVKWQL